MKIVLICGMSGVGKTTIVQNLCERYPNKFNCVFSYTDRQVREKDEWGHTFVDSKFMDLLLERNSSDIVAQSTIEKNRYCSIASQFDKNKINLYIVDIDGINDTFNFFPYADIMTILIRRREIEADCVRINRDVLVPSRDDVDFLIDNNGNIESSANLLNALVNFDFFKRPSHVVYTLEDKIENIDAQYRFLDEIKESLYEQIWYREKSSYNKLCRYVEEKVNNDFDFRIDIVPDTSPEICDGELTFNLIGEYEHEDLVWAEINNMIDKMTYYAISYCNEHELNSIRYRLSVSEYFKDLSHY